jgi:hypothetical protein
MRPVTLAIFILGLLLGPGYFLYTKYLTGTAAGTYPLTRTARGFEPLVLRLPPEMSPVRLILRLSAQHGPSFGGATPRNRYRAAVSRGGATAAETPIELASNTVESSFQEFGHVLATLDVGQASEYRLQIEETAEPGMQVTGASVEVRRNVGEPDMRVVWAGVAMLAVAVAGLVFAR